ncbi:hypothetical protein WNY97_14215 [Pseudoalteromonas fuliginea]|uniref:hypothetical protein n=1 Tax=Pseudoalteromonas fuliginea TaxID=1872678 RepID=UPI0031779A30
MSIAALFVFYLRAEFFLLSPDASDTDDSPESEVTLETTRFVSTKADQHLGVVFDSCDTKLSDMKVNDEFSICIELLLIELRDETVEIKLATTQPLYLAWIKVNWPSALEHMLGLDTIMRNRLLNSVIPVIGQYDLQNLSEWIQNKGFDNSTQVDLITVAYSSLMDESPITAIEDVRFSLSPAVKSGVIDKLLNQWSRKNAGAVMEWFSQQPRPDMYAHLMGFVLMQLIQQQPNDAENIISELPNSQLKFDTIKFYTKKLASENLEQSLNWVNSIENEASRHVGIVQLLKYMATNEEYIGRSFDVALAQEDPFFRDKLLNNLSIDIPYNKLGMLIDLAPTLPISAKKWVMSNIGSRLIENDPDMARDWLKSLMPSNEASYAKRIVGEKSIERDLPFATELANDISDQDERMLLIESILKFVYGQDDFDFELLYETLRLSSSEIDQAKIKFYNADTH